MSAGPVLGFELEHVDPVSGQIKQIFLKFFLDDNTIELLTGVSTFLKRIYFPDVKFEDLYLGGTLTIYNRIMSIKAYANVATTRYMEMRERHFVVRAHSLSTNFLGEIYNLAKSCKMVLGRARTTYGPVDHAYSGLKAQRGDILLEVVGLSGEATFADEIAKMGGGGPRERLSVFEMPSSQVEELMKMCSACPEIPEGCTLCIIKPHVVKSRNVGGVLSSIIKAGFSVDGLFCIHLSQQMVEEMFDVYRTIYSNYSATLYHMSSGPCMAVMVSGGGGGGGRVDQIDTVERFRELAGPLHPELAKILRPDSLRGKFGTTDVLNGLHCTDLPGDGELECKFFFSTLANL